jgi:hypothetical protein
MTYCSPRWGTIFPCRFSSTPSRVTLRPPSGSPSSGTRATVRVEYDIRDGSPFHFLDWENFPRTQDGVLMHGVDSDENVWLEGIMTSWISGVSHDTAELAWTEEALGEAVRSSAYVSVSAQNPTGPLNYYSAYAVLPDNPADWTSVTIHDPPEILEPDVTGPLPFDEEIFMRIPARVDLVRYSVWIVASNDMALWFIETPSDGTSIVFGSLPWPSSVSRREFLMPDGIELPWLMTQGNAYNADPFDNYILWSDLSWGGSHFVSSARAAWLELGAPKD